MKYLLSLLIIFFVLFISCEDDISINGEWENIPVVYGLLDPSDTAHYIRINKAFLGEGDVYEMAQESDSLNYSQTLSVNLIEYKLKGNNQYGLDPYNEANWESTDRVITLYKTDEFVKETFGADGEPGVFSAEENTIYKTTEQLKEEFKYRLEIEIPGFDKLIWSEAFMLGEILMKSYFHPTDPVLSLSNEVNPYKIEWESSVYGRVFQPFIIFYYYEIEDNDSTLNNVTIFYEKKYSDRVRVPSDVAGTNMSQIIGGVQFYKSLSELIPEKQNVERYFNKIDIGFLSGGNEFYNYLNLSETTIGYGQEAPEFTNIGNGVGLFDARAQYFKRGLRFNKATGSLDSLADGRYTKHLNFTRFTME